MRSTVWAAILVAATATPGVCASYDDLNAGISYFNQEQYDNAIIWFDKALAAGDLIPDHKRLAHLDRGLAYRTKGETQKAIADFTSAIAAQPRDLQAYKQRSAAYLDLGDIENTLSDYREMRKLRPQDHEILMNFGWLSWQLGKIEDSANAFAEFSGTDMNSWLWLQLSNARLGKSLMDYSEGVRSRDWPGPIARFFRGSISDSELLQAASSDSQICAAHLYVGLWRTVQQDRAAAVPSLKSALGKCGEGSPYWRLARATLKDVAPGEIK